MSASVYGKNSLEFEPKVLYQVKHSTNLLSISSTFYMHIFCMKFWRQKLQNCVLGLKFFGAKISAKKCALKMLMKLTPKGNNFGRGFGTLDFKVDMPA